VLACVFFCSHWIGFNSGKCPGKPSSTTGALSSETLKSESPADLRPTARLSGLRFLASLSFFPCALLLWACLWAGRDR
jgi:hypothetical protein